MMLSKVYGICGNSITGYPDATYMSHIGLGWLRTLVLDFGTYEAMYNQVPNTTNLAAVITGQTANLNNDFWGDGWRERYVSVVTEFCERFYKKVRLIEFANEWDFWNNEDRAEKAVELAVLGTNVCKRYGILGVLGSVASGDWKNQMQRAVDHLDDVEEATGYRAVHGVAFHPYVSYVWRENEFVVPSSSEPWERLSDKIQDALDIARRPLAITECGIKVGDAGGEDKQALWVHGAFEDELRMFTPDQLLVACLFAWTDANGSPGEQGNNGFGMIGWEGNLRPSYRAATYQMQVAPMVDIPVARLLQESQERLPEPPAPETPPEPETPPQDGQNSTGGMVPATIPVADLHQMRWQAVVHNAPYHHDYGFERHWRMPDNAWWGSPITELEYTLEDGRPARVFANVVVAYNGDDTIEVL